MTSTGSGNGSNPAQATTTYTYRADGMRTSKTLPTTNENGVHATTQYLDDGQMGIQDIEQNVVTNYGLGARGIDVILRTDSNGTGIGFPVYDLHGNMVATLGRTGSGSWSIVNERSFDAWGSVRSGSGVNTGRYCANLGHKQDDESGLTYMRARYYEGISGRFVSEDQKNDGFNWYSYCGNEPIRRTDGSGHAFNFEDPVVLAAFIAANGLFVLGTIVIGFALVSSKSPTYFLEACAAVLVGIGMISLALDFGLSFDLERGWLSKGLLAALGKEAYDVSIIMGQYRAGSLAAPEAESALANVCRHTFEIMAAIVALEAWEWDN